jgi:hypothetical protein
LRFTFRSLEAFFCPAINPTFDDFYNVTITAVLSGRTVSEVNSVLGLGCNAFDRTTLQTNQRSITLDLRNEPGAEVEFVVQVSNAGDSGFGSSICAETEVS